MIEACQSRALWGTWNVDRDRRPWILCRSENKICEWEKWRRIKVISLYSFMFHCLENKFGLVWCCLMTPGLSITFGVMFDHTFFLKSQITRSDIRPHIKWAVSLVIAYGHFNLPQGFVWACMGSHTYFINPEGLGEQNHINSSWWSTLGELEPVSIHIWVACSTTEQWMCWIRKVGWGKRLIITVNWLWISCPWRTRNAGCSECWMRLSSFEPVKNNLMTKTDGIRSVTPRTIPP